MLDNFEIDALKFYAAVGVDEVYSENPQTFAALKEVSFLSEPSPSPLISVNDAGAAASKAAAECQSVEDLQNAIRAFELCPLQRVATNAVVGGGVPTPKLLVISDVPNVDEDRTGQAFSGESGELFRKILTAVGRSLDTDTFAFPVSFYRPAGGRLPTKAELDTIRPFVLKYIELLAPEMILAMGSAPLLCLFARTEAMASVKGQWIKYEGIPLLPIYSLQMIAGSKEAKREAWSNLQLLINPPEESNLSD